MPSSGELRLRTLILALTALGGIWIALVIQRTLHAPAAAFASGPQPADFAAPKLVRVPGLNRPVAATPIANVSPRVRPFTRVPTKQTPDAQISVEASVAERDVVASRWTITGTHRGTFQGVPATGRLVTFSGIDFSRVVEGKVAEHWAQFDLLAVLQQIGALPAAALA